MSRALAYSDPEVARLVTEHFVPVAGDDRAEWIDRGSDGDFFRALMGGVRRPDAHDPSHQGSYAFTADGRLLAGSFLENLDADGIHAMLRRALRRWRRLPWAARAPVPDPAAPYAAAPFVSRAPPPGGLVLSTYARRLHLGAGGELTRSTHPGTLFGRTLVMPPQLDHLWITRSESAELVRQAFAGGACARAPANLSLRMACYNLVDATRGGPVAWRRKEVKQCDAGSWLVAADSHGAWIRLQGKVSMESAGAAYDARLEGWIHWDARARRIDRFDAVAIGDEWSRDLWGAGTPAGQTVLGVAFDLADPAASSASIPPEWSWQLGYYGAPGFQGQVLAPRVPPPGVPFQAGQGW